ncbi:MAG: hypothetical protein C6W56_12700 [Caldibacillus debilis]|nr:MAG: hypothetical protein C6W56_12700 [Caldibacillus debilis]
MKKIAGRGAVYCRCEKGINDKVKAVQKAGRSAFCRLFCPLPCAPRRRGHMPAAGFFLKRKDRMMPVLSALFARSPQRNIPPVGLRGVPRLFFRVKGRNLWPDFGSASLPPDLREDEPLFRDVLFLPCGGQKPAGPVSRADFHRMSVYFPSPRSIMEC